MDKNKDSIGASEKVEDLIKIQKSIIDGLGLLQYKISLDWVILDCNSLVLRTLGHKNKKDLIGKPFLSAICTPSSTEKAEKLLLKWKKAGSLKDEELQIKTLSGKVIDVILNVNTIYDKDSKALYCISTQTDITKLKKCDEEIMELAKFPSENPNPVLRVNNEHKIIYANEPAKIMMKKLGIKGKKIPKKLIDSVMPSIKKNNKVRTLELKIDTSFYIFSIVKVKDSDDYNIYANDITDMKKLEKSEQNKEKEKILLTDRVYIARELHDTVTQTLFSANLIAEVIPRLWKKDPKSVPKRLNEIRMLNNAALTEMRSLLFDLRPDTFKGEELRGLIKELVKSIGIKSKIPISVSIIKKYDYPSKIVLSFYHIARESLNNIVKHSCATKARLVLKSLHGKITMEINDDGIGFDTKDVSYDNLGLIIMKERAKMIGASLDLKSVMGKGTKIIVTYSNKGK